MAQYLIMTALDVIDTIDMINSVETCARVHRHFKDRSNPLEDFNDADFLYRFRVSKDSASYLVQHLQLERKTCASTALLPVQKLVIALNFYATGTFQRVLGDLSGVHLSTVSRIVHQVTKELCTLFPSFIHLRANDVRRIKEDFYAMNGFPNVVGALDCTHIRISKPSVPLLDLFKSRSCTSSSSLLSDTSPLFRAACSPFEKCRSIDAVFTCQLESLTNACLRFS